MPSPFPGMDPYLENPSRWPEFHGALLFCFRAALNAVLPPRYVASVDLHVWLHEPDAETRTRIGKPDVYLTDQPGTTGPASGGATATLPAPAVVLLPVVRRVGPRYLRILDSLDRRVVTVVELLSPSNKDLGADRDQYLAKRNEYLATGLNLVEIDLLRAGHRPSLGEPMPPPGAYLVFVSRAADFPQVGIWTFTIRDALPEIPVPLDPEDGVASLALKPCLDKVYDEARYATILNYTQDSVPPLVEPDATWARDLLAARAAPTHQGEQP
jgi:hypothetical protein